MRITATEIRLRKVLQALIINSAGDEILTGGSSVILNILKSDRYRKAFNSIHEICRNRQEEVDRILEGKKPNREVIARYINNNIQHRDDWSLALRQADDIIQLIK